MSQVEFQTLISEMAQAIQVSQIMMEETSLEYFLSYFDRDGETMRARTKDIKVSISENGQKKDGAFTVPTATLVPHTRMCMDTVEVTLHTKLLSCDHGLIAEIGRNDAKETAAANTAGCSECDVKLVFRNNQPAEGIQETINLLNKSI